MAGIPAFGQDGASNGNSVAEWFIGQTGRYLYSTGSALIQFALLFCEEKADWANADGLTAFAAVAKGAELVGDKIGGRTAVTVAELCRQYIADVVAMVLHRALWACSERSLPMPCARDFVPTIQRTASCGLLISAAIDG